MSAAAKAISSRYRIVDWRDVFRRWRAALFDVSHTVFRPAVATNRAHVRHISPLAPADADLAPRHFLSGDVLGRSDFKANRFLITQHQARWRDKILAADHEHFRRKRCSRPGRVRRHQAYLRRKCRNGLAMTRFHHRLNRPTALASLFSFAQEQLGVDARSCHAGCRRGSMPLVVPCFAEAFRKSTSRDCHYRQRADAHMASALPCEQLK